jgi:hypothetical protein
MPKKTSQTDGSGERFDTTREMCRAHGVSEAAYYGRIRRGVPKDEALRPEHRGDRGIACTDHLGNGYASVAAMCRAYGMDRSAFEIRNRLGWDLETALTKPVAGRPSEAEDHLGNIYPSISAMCRTYGVKQNVFYNRLRYGWTLEEALTGKPSPENPVHERGHGSVTDHLGKRHDSARAMCRAYGITYEVYKKRVDRGWTVEDALTRKGPTSSQKTTDTDGTVYPSQSAFARKHGLSRATVSARKKRGYPEERMGEPAIPRVSAQYRARRLGERRQMKNGKYAFVAAYRGAMDIDVQFEDGPLVEHVPYQRFAACVLTGRKNKRSSKTAPAGE